MRYGRTVTGTFVSRPNRFVAKVDIGGSVKTVHVKNTGRCGEILIPGTKVVLEDCGNQDRKTRFDLIAAYKGGNLINIDSQAPNKAFAEFVPRSGLFGDDPVATETLQEASGLETGALSLLLMNLELSGAVRRMPGKRYIKI